MTAPRVYIALQQFCERGTGPLDLLKEAGIQVQRNDLGRRLRHEEVVAALGQSDAVVAGVEPYDAQILSSLPRLRCISRCGVGTDSIDLEAARSRNVAVLTTAEEVTEPTAQMTAAMILALARNIPQHVLEMGSGEWKKRTGHLLSEWRVGLVGFGRIGQEVERCLRPFRPKILVHDPQLDRSKLPPGARACGLDELLAESDLVSLHAARRAEQGVLIGAAEIARMKPGSRLVNTARGYLVDEKALAAALESGLLSGAALDVFCEEPYTGPLRRLPQVLLTPHVATLTDASRASMELGAVRNLLEFFRT